MNPRIIYCAITGYGQSGPRAMTAAHDLNYAAETGMLALAAGADGAPVPPAALVADIGGGSYPAVINILLALRERERTGRGCKLDIAMADNLYHLHVLGDGRRPRRRSLAAAGKGDSSPAAAPATRSIARATTGSSPPRRWSRSSGRPSAMPSRCPRGARRRTGPRSHDQGGVRADPGKDGGGMARRVRGQGPVLQRGELDRAGARRSAVSRARIVRPQIDRGRQSHFGAANTDRPGISRRRHRRLSGAGRSETRSWTRMSTNASRQTSID